MLDTNQEMQDKQMEIILSKTPKQRAQMGIDMIDFSYKTIKRMILAKKPNLSDKELVAEIFQWFYKNDFSQEELEEISQAIRNS